MPNERGLIMKNIIQKIKGYLKRIFSKKEKSSSFKFTTEDTEPFSFNNAFTNEEEAKNPFTFDNAFIQDEEDEKDFFLNKIDDCLGSINYLQYQGYQDDLIYLDKVTKTYIEMQKLAIKKGEKELFAKMFATEDVVSYGGRKISKKEILTTMDMIKTMLEVRLYEEQNANTIAHISNSIKTPYVSTSNKAFIPDPKFGIAEAISLEGEVRILNYHGSENDSEWLKKLIEKYQTKTRILEKSNGRLPSSWLEFDRTELEKIATILKKVEFAKNIRHQEELLYTADFAPKNGNTSIVKVKKTQAPVAVRVLRKK